MIKNGSPATEDAAWPGQSAQPTASAGVAIKPTAAAAVAVPVAVPITWGALIDKLVEDGVETYKTPEAAMIQQTAAPKQQSVGGGGGVNSVIQSETCEKKGVATKQEESERKRTEITWTPLTSALVDMIETLVEEGEEIPLLIQRMGTLVENWVVKEEVEGSPVHTSSGPQGPP
eukprot:GHVS01066941.1.p1 GENE.GHVS01066941.1~~GHVS01066941.1.p1  ORF type:complete len:174 (+),score=46.89 GHVS01066941.1:271-792(+)